MRHYQADQLCIVGVLGKEREEGAERISEQIRAENFPNLMKDRNINIQEAQRTPGKMKSMGPTPRHIIITFSKIERILKAAREK